MTCVFCECTLWPGDKYEVDEEGDTICIPCFDRESDTGEIV